MSAIKRHIRIYGLVRLVTGGWMKRKFNFYGESFDQQDDCPYIILSNHNTDYDPLLVGQSFSRHMYFVAADNIMRKGFISKAIAYLAAPITRAKGKSDMHTVAEILRTLKRGTNVCIFAEGNKSFNGLTCEILPSTGKMVKKSGAGLITYRMSGGYFSAPRWGTTLRKGRIDGRIIGKYSPEEIKGMAADEINRIIVRDLHEDAYETQETAHVRFSGKSLAEGIESVLFICPLCGQIGTLSGKGNNLHCGCGYEAEYTELGYIEKKTEEPDGSPKALTFRTVTEWDIWQRKELDKIISGNQGKSLFSDEEIIIREIGSDHQVKNESGGHIIAFADRLEMQENKLMFCDITGMSIFRRNCLMINAAADENRYFEIQGERSFNALKYLYLYEKVSERK